MTRLYKMTTSNFDLESKSADDIRAVLVKEKYGYKISVQEKNEQLVLVATPKEGEKQSNMLFVMTYYSSDNYKWQHTDEDSRLVIGIAISADNYDAGEPDELETIAILVREWEKQMAFELSNKSLKLADRNALMVQLQTELRHIFMATDSWNSNSRNKSRVANATAAAKEFEASFNQSSNIAITYDESHWDGKTGLEIQRDQLVVKLPLDVVDTKLLHNIAELFPQAKWEVTRRGGYETGYRFMN